MITEIMQKVAADLDKKDAAIASGLGLAGGVATLAYRKYSNK